MGYMNISNLYKEQDILMFKECYALEKIDGTSAHIRWKDVEVGYFSGGEPYEKFVALFDTEKLKQNFAELFDCDVIVFGEAYGGKCQGMSATYGKELKFIVFDVKVGDRWLNVPNAEDVAKKLGLEFVHYNKIKANMESIDKERDEQSVQAVRNGTGNKKREGVVLRPLEEFTKNNGDRVICKHKNDEFRETKTPREVDPNQIKILEEANEIAEEWVTENRLNHILSHLGNPSDIKDTGKVIKEMIDDILREAEGEIMISKQVPKAISLKCAKLYKERIKL
jgi:hypothetical protein